MGGSKPSRAGYFAACGLSAHIKANRLIHLRLFARHLDLGGAENPRSRDLRCDQECRNNGRHAYQSEKLIHRKHLSFPQDNFKSQAQKARSICPLRGLLIPCQNLVRVGRSGNREQRQNRNDGQCPHAVIVVFDCGQKCQSMAHFRDEQEKHRGGVSPCPRARAPAKEPAPAVFAQLNGAYSMI